MYSYLRDLWKNPKRNFGSEAWRDKVSNWRKEPTIVRINRPTRIDRARSLGYKAKQGYVIVRARMKKGTSKRPMPKGGRRPKRMGLTKIRRTHSKQRVLEMRVIKKYPNLEVLNSYWIGEDGKNIWYEIILVDPTHPVIVSDPKINWIHSKVHKGRAYRGLTSAGKKTRGLRK